MLGRGSVGDLGGVDAASNSKNNNGRATHLGSHVESCWMGGVVKGGEGAMDSDGERLRRRRLW